MKKICILLTLVLLCGLLSAGCQSTSPDSAPAGAAAEELPENESAGEETGTKPGTGETGTKPGTGETGSGLITIGFSQLGAESDWRSANTSSMKETFTRENGYELIFEDGQQNQMNQLKDIRRFIQQRVDYIVIAPVIEDGWDTVLQEAKNAGIPVIIVDRKVNTSDESLFTSWVGSDFELEGRKMAAWINSFASARGIAPEELHIVDIQGNIGATAQIGRTKGILDAAGTCGWDLITSVSGDFTQNKGREVAAELLKTHPEINIFYCENDNMAFGVIEAVEKAGRRVGSDITAGEIMVVSFDGVNKAALEDVLTDRITCIAECNPLHGPRVEALIRALEAGEVPEKYSYVDEDIYAGTDLVRRIQVDGVVYDMTILDREKLEEIAAARQQQ